MEEAQPAFTLVLALAAGVFAQAVARHLRVPGIVLLLVAGAALGPDGFGWVRPLALGEQGLFALVELSVAIILFEGGLNLEISRLRREQAPIRRLVTYGSLVTLIGAALAVRSFLPHWDWMTALVFGGLVIVTGPTVVGPLVDALRLRPRVATVLEAEGVMIDPIGAIVAVLLLEVALAPGADSLTSGAAVLLTRAGLGVVSGVAAGFAIAGLLRTRLLPEGYGNIVVLASVLFLFQGCEELLPHSGLLAVTVGGVVVGNIPSSVDRNLREFKDQLSVLLIGMLFVLLAASVRLEDVLDLGTPGLLVVAALVLVVRPAAVAISTAGSELSWRERLLVAWIAPRGIVAAAVASATAVALARADLRGEEQLLPLVFLTIGCTVLLAGFTAGPVASLLAQRLPGRDGVAILGASGLGLLLGGELRRAGAPVVFLDSNPQNCRRAEEEGFPVVYGDALQERTLLRARVGSIGSVVGLTPNQMLNGVFVSRTRDRFEVPHGYMAVEHFEGGLAPELVREGEARVLFDGPHEVERWDVRERHGAVQLERWEFEGAPEREGEAEEPAEGAARESGDCFVVLCVRRGKAVLLMHGSLQLKPGDVAAVAVHAPEREKAHAGLRALGFAPHVEEETEESAAVAS